MTTLSYSVTEPALRSPVEEWQPHGKQSESTTEWWYLTALVHDVAGNPYFLVWCPFHFTGEKASPASVGLPSDERATAALVGFTDYRNNFRIGHFPAAVVNEAETWNPETNAVRFVAGDYSSEWSYKASAMNLTVTSSQLSYDLRLTGVEQVMYAEDSRHYTLEPFSRLDVFENPNNTFFEGPSRLINDETGETVGVAVTESMDVRIMQNAPYAANQH